MNAHWIGVAFGAFVVVQGVRAMVEYLRLHLRGERVPGVIVGSRDAPGSPGVRRRAGVFRFTTRQGQTIERRSATYSPRGPRPGTAVTVVYDPARPEKRAERAGITLLMVTALTPLMIAVGIAIILLNLADM
ncbi:hypothetical protein GCM10009678_50490 [Actinomadura kijaniata]|uniref:DUF3592 domain-containing protein n=1 Tax=Actinomadura namibiensis TaxID=182080 RepID=A0A7W3LI91_ACTNM|nr:DUF3592 domain-containing protein [Actinomadura namibiensis]MBA8948579.1 hypothetical protein [Actinomadura namibiensis]